MTATDVITKCDRLKPNIYSHSQKREWLNNIEAKIRQYASMYAENIGDHTFETEENPTLFLPECKADIYVYYLISMIDLSNQEYGLYNNSASYYNNELKTWKCEYRRQNIPLTSTTIKT